jgi:acyl-CoA reductase-like NAD-dependent aldehyde dehydrogenase
MWVDRKHLFIGGEWVTPASNARIDVINATSEESLGSVPEASPQDVDRAVTAARRALDSGWRTSAPSERAAALSRFADALEKRAPEIARAVRVQNGMPLSLSEQFEGGYAVALARYYGWLPATQVGLSARIHGLTGAPSHVKSNSQRSRARGKGGCCPWQGRTVRYRRGPNRSTDRQ